MNWIPSMYSISFLTLINFGSNWFRIFIFWTASFWFTSRIFLIVVSWLVIFYYRFVMFLLNLSL